MGGIRADYLSDTLSYFCDDFLWDSHECHCGQCIRVASALITVADTFPVLSV